jgi:hypothetical protein
MWTDSQHWCGINLNSLPDFQVLTIPAKTNPTDRKKKKKVIHAGDLQQKI